MEDQWERMQRLANLALACSLRWRWKVLYRKRCESALTVQTAWRGCTARHELRRLRQRQAARVLETAGMCWVARKRLQRLRVERDAAMWLQSGWRARGPRLELAAARAARLRRLALAAKQQRELHEQEEQQKQRELQEQQQKQRQRHSDSDAVSRESDADGTAIIQVSRASFRCVSNAAC